MMGGGFALTDRFVAGRSGGTLLVMACALGGVGGALVQDAFGQSTDFVSKHTDGTAGTGHSRRPVVAAGGRYVAFESDATNLVDNDTNGFTDVFVHDLQTGVTERVSVTSAGAQGDGGSFSPAISADGRYVAFNTDAPNIYGGVLLDCCGPIALHDRTVGTTIIVTIDADLGFPVGAGRPALSGNGRFVAFSTVSRMFTNDSMGLPDIYYYEIATGAKFLISKNLAGTYPDSSSVDPDVSYSGQHVAYRSFATDLVAGDTLGHPDIFVRDAFSATPSIRVSVDSAGVEADGASEFPAISGDGKFVAYKSFATNLLGAGNDTNGFDDIFVHEIATSQTTLVSQSTGGAQADGWMHSDAPAISEDGSLVVFGAFSETLDASDTNFPWMDVFIRNRITGETTLASVATDGTQGDFNSPSNNTGIGSALSMSADGNVLAFDSLATTLHAGDGTSADIFVVNADTDGDGLSDDWETNGVPIAGSASRLMLPGANPMHKDLYFEVDVMVGRWPEDAVTQMLIDAFANSPVPNPDAITGITVHFESALPGGMVDEDDLVLVDFPNGFTEFDVVKAAHFGTVAQQGDAALLEAKGKAYRYCIFGNTHSGDSSGGLGERPGDDFMVTLGAPGWLTKIAAKGVTYKAQLEACVFMHELGHNLNLLHGGHQSDPDVKKRFNLKPNYYSIMNYLWQTPKDNLTGWRLDFSTGTLPTIDESDLTEADGLGGDPAVMQPVGPLDAKVVPQGGAVDWNRNGNPTDVGVAANVNKSRTSAPDTLDVLEDHDDWANLKFSMAGSTSYADGEHDTGPDEPELDVDTDNELDALGATCFADVDGDGNVGINDFLDVLAQWGPCGVPCSADFSGPGDVPDGMVGIHDFLDVLGNWGACP